VPGDVQIQRLCVLLATPRRYKIIWVGYGVPNFGAMPIREDQKRTVCLRVVHGAEQPANETTQGGLFPAFSSLEKAPGLPALFMGLYSPLTKKRSKELCTDAADLFLLEVMGNMAIEAIMAYNRAITEGMCILPLFLCNRTDGVSNTTYVVYRLRYIVYSIICS
jgi:hypothetical protein